MKKTKIALSAKTAAVFAMICSTVFALSACGGTPKSYKTLEVNGFDADNSTNLCRWEQVPLVSREILDKGMSGGEGGQWPLCLSGSTDGSLMFYGTNVGGLFRSTDGGKSWHKSMKDLLAHGVCDAEVDPNNKTKVICFGINGSMASYSTGIYLSADGGESWDFVKHFPVGEDRASEERIAFDPTSYSAEFGASAVVFLSLVEKEDALNPTLLTEETRGLYRSTDGGKTWARIHADLGDAIVRVTSSGRLYVGNDSGLFLSCDRGESFSRLLDKNVTGLDVVGDTAYILTDVKGETSAVELWKSESETVEKISAFTGENVNLINLEWQKFYVEAGNDKKFDYHFSPSVHKVSSIKVSPVDPDHMVLAYCNSAYGASEYYTYASMYSTDGGKTWQASVRDNEREKLGLSDDNFLPHNTRKMDFYWSPTDPDKVWDYENDFLSSSSDGGKTFFWDSNGINGLCIGGVFGMNIFDSDLIYAGAQDYNGAFSTDGGKSWKYVDVGGNIWGGHVYGGYAASKDVIFGAQASGWTSDRYLAISYDGGKTVVRHDGDPDYKINAGYGNRLNGQANFVGYQAFNDRNVLFLGDLRSPDMGKTWQRMNGVTGVYAHDNINGTLYGIDDNARNVVFSEDNGNTWNVLVHSTSLNQWWDEIYISDLAFDSQNKQVYVTAGWADLYKIDVATKSVSKITDNVPLGLQKEGMPTAEQMGQFRSYFPHRLTTVAVDPNHPEIVYVGGASYGYQSDCSLFRSCDGGETFYTINSNSTTSVVQYGEQGGFEPTCIRVAKNGDLWVAGGCLGFSKINAPYETDETRAVKTQKLTLEFGYKTDVGGYLVHAGRSFSADDPVREGYVFEGWYLDKEQTARYGGEPVTQDLTLYAKWRKE